jgi:Ala-tRNA(Pro) deacylase
MPPFGNFYDMPVYTASALSEDEEIVFNSGTHTDAIRMRYNDYIRLVDPM